MALIQIPVRGKVDGQGTQTPVGADLVQIQLSGTSVLGFFGKGDFNCTTTARFENGQPIAVPPSLGTLTVPNGDTVQFRFHWLTDPSPTTVFQVHGQIEFLSGTGRFSQLGGTGAFQGLVDTTDNSFHLDLQGVIVK